MGCITIPWPAFVSRCVQIHVCPCKTSLNLISIRSMLMYSPQLTSMPLQHIHCRHAQEISSLSYPQSKALGVHIVFSSKKTYGIFLRCFFVCFFFIKHTDICALASTAVWHYINDGSEPKTFRNREVTASMWCQLVWCRLAVHSWKIVQNVKWLT